MGRSNRRVITLELATVCLVLSVLLFRTSYTVADPDLWGHVRFGQDVWATGKIVHSDTYSYLSGDQPWINHEWLCEVIFAALFDRLGAAGLIVFKCVVVLGLLGFIYRDMCLRGGAPFRAGIVLLGLGFLMLSGAATVRPQLFTYAGFFLLLLILRSAEEGRVRRLWLAVPLAAAWANLHGGVLAGLGILLIWSCAHLAQSPWRSRKLSPLLSAQGITILAATAVSGLAILMNPYGLKLPLFLLKTATVPRPDIAEWGPIDMGSTAGLIYLALAIAGVAALAKSRRRRSPALIVVFACTAVLPLQAWRHVPLFALAVGPLLGEHLFDAWEQLSPSSAPGGRAARDRRPPAAVALVFLACAAVFAALALPHFTGIRIDPRHFAFPARAVARLKERHFQGNLAVFFDWAEYVIWHLGPEAKVSIDGRRETVYSERVREENLQWIHGLGEWDNLLERYPTDIALVGRTLPVFNLMRIKPGWVVGFEDPFCAVFVREGSELANTGGHPEMSDVPPDGAGLCFP